MRRHVDATFRAGRAARRDIVPPRATDVRFAAPKRKLGGERAAAGGRLVPSVQGPVVQSNAASGSACSSRGDA